MQGHALVQLAWGGGKGKRERVTRGKEEGGIAAVLYPSYAG